MVENFDYECPLLIDQYGQEKYARIAWGAWLWNLRDWDYFVTLTYGNFANGDGPGVPKVRATMNSYASLFPAMGSNIAAVCERGHVNGRLHWHALIKDSVRGFPEWRYGYSKFERVQSERSAYYIAKYITKGELDICIQLDDRLRSVV